MTKLYFDVDLPDGNLYKESSTILSGEEYPPVIDVPGLCKVGLSFVMMLDSLSLQISVLKRCGVNYDSSSIYSFYWRDHWQIYYKRRAIENTAYVVAPAQTGLHYGRRQSHGHAMVIDPWGTVCLMLENSGCCNSSG